MRLPLKMWGTVTRAEVWEVMTRGADIDGAKVGLCLLTPNHPACKETIRYRSNTTCNLQIIPRLLQKQFLPKDEPQEVPF